MPGGRQTTRTARPFCWRRLTQRQPWRRLAHLSSGCGREVRAVSVRAVRHVLRPGIFGGDVGTSNAGVDEAMLRHRCRAVEVAPIDNDRIMQQLVQYGQIDARSEE